MAVTTVIIIATTIHDFIFAPLFKPLNLYSFIKYFLNKLLGFQNESLF